MDDFDDPMLERLLGGGAPLDVDLAYGRVTRRVRQVRRRRVMVAGTAACVVLVAGGAFALNRTDPDTPGLQPAATFDSVDGSTADTDGTATEDTSVDGTATTDATGTSTPEATAPTTAATGGTSSPTTSGTTPSTTGATTGTTSATTPTSGTPTTSAPQTATFSGIGGAVTVRLANGVLSLQGTSPTSGYSTEIKENRADRVEVIFTNGDHETKIRVDLVNGSMVPRVDEQ